MSQAAPNLPFQIGPYRVLAHICESGMGQVFRGEDPRSNTPVAIKTFCLPSGQQLAGLRREIRTLAQIEHPGVIQILNEGMQDGQPWYATELLEGQTLRWRRFAGTSLEAPGPFASTSLVDSSDPPVGSSAGEVYLPTHIGPATRRPIEPNQLPGLLEIFRRLCAPLAHVHGEGLVHCDLKPENIFLCNDGRLVLVDFGLISRFGAAVTRELLDFEFFVGTAEYVAPEQWADKPVDARTDLYAIGCILYECLSGVAPFQGPRSKLCEKHLKADIPRIRQVNPWIPAKLDDLLQSLLAKTPSLRPGSADEVAQHLEALGATPPSQPRVTRPHLFRPALTGRARTVRDIGQLVLSPEQKARLILIEGESGIGKTHLAMEAARIAKRSDLQVVTSDCAPHMDLLNPMRNLLRVYGDCASKHPKDTHEVLRQFGPILARVEPTILRGSGVSELPEAEPMQVDAERMRVIEAFVRVLETFSRLKRLIWIIDDLQWADELTIEVLNQIHARRGQFGPMAIIGTFRSDASRDRMQHLLQHEDTSLIELGRLNHRAVIRVVTDMLGAPPPDGLVQALTSKSNGNPFFMSQYLQAAVDEKLLTRRKDGQWSWLKETTDDLRILPSSPTELVAHRLNSLPPQARRLVSLAAVIGRIFSPARAIQIGQMKQSDAAPALSELLKKEVFEETSDGRIRFCHDKIREVAYAGIPQKSRHELHRRTARCLQRARTEGAQDVVSRALAHHWLEANEPAKAIGELERSAEEALDRGGYREAISHLEHALELSTPREGVPAVALPPLKRAGWHQRLGEIQIAAGQLDSSTRNAEATLDLLDISRPRSQGAWLRVLLGQLLRQFSHRILPKRLFLAHENQEVLVEATRATAHMARVAFFENDRVRLIASSIWSINLAERAGHYFHAARTYNGLGWTFGLARFHRVANGYFARARHVGEASDDVSGLIFCLTSEALYRIGRAELNEAEAALASSKELCESAHDPQMLEITDTLLGHPAFFRGRFADAIERHAIVLNSAQTRRDPQHQAWSLYFTARALLAKGEYESARSMLEEASAHLHGLTDEVSNITCSGLAAIGALRSLEIEDARRLSAKTRQYIGRTKPTSFLAVHGFEAVAEVALYDLRIKGDTQSRRRAVRDVRALQRAASAFPVMTPRALTFKGRLLCLCGKTAAARKTLDRARLEAQRLGLPYEEACATSEIGRIYDERSAERAVHSRLAGRIFDQLGCSRPEAAYLDAKR